MCQQCVDACRKYFPELGDGPEMGAFLMGYTAFPFADPEHVERQIAALARRRDRGELIHDDPEFDVLADDAAVAELERLKTEDWS